MYELVKLLRTRSIEFVSPVKPVPPVPGAGRRPPNPDRENPQKKPAKDKKPEPKPAQNPLPKRPGIVV